MIKLQIPTPIKAEVLVLKIQLILLRLLAPWDLDLILYTMPSSLVLAMKQISRDQYLGHSAQAKFTAKF